MDLLWQRSAAKQLEIWRTKKKYDGYELNTVFDINLYESFYRIHDPQIGRFLEIDPKANEFEGPYVAMGNNPISNNDPFGDITHYYSSSGELMRSQKDDRGAIVTIVAIMDKNLDNFNTWGTITDKLQELAKGTAMEGVVDNFTLGVLGSAGISYDSQEYFEYHDKHENDFYTGTEVYQPLDGKGKLVNEHAATTNVKDGYMRIDQNSDRAGDPGNSAPKYGTMGVHTHDNDNRLYTLIENGVYRSASNSRGKAALDWDKQGEKFTNSDPSKGTYRVVVTDTHMYLYTAGKVVIAVDRKMVPSKNSESIK